MDEIIYSSRSEQWGTPQDLFDTLHREFRFNLDAAASKENAKCERFYTKEDNGLMRPWDDSTFLNPPYGKNIGQWMHKAALEGLHVTVVALVPARTDTDWFHRSVWGVAAELRFIKGRLRFEGGNHSATFPSVVVVFRPGDCDCRLSTIDRQGRRRWWTPGRLSAA
jgi:phage N-6-adenine-methyltransferase